MKFAKRLCFLSAVFCAVALATPSAMAQDDAAPLATAQDNAPLTRAEFRAEMAEFRAEMAEFRAEMAASRAEFRAEMAEFRAAMREDLAAFETRINARMDAGFEKQAVAIAALDASVSRLDARVSRLQVNLLTMFFVAVLAALLICFLPERRRSEPRPDPR